MDLDKKEGDKRADKTMERLTHTSWGGDSWLTSPAHVCSFDNQSESAHGAQLSMLVGEVVFGGAP